MPIYLFASVKVAIVGDSITIGTGATKGYSYVDNLRNRFIDEGKDVELIIRAYGGAMTDTVFQITVSLITTEKPDYIVYFIGINDCGVALNKEETNDELRIQLINNFSLAMNKARGNCKRIILGGIDCVFYPPYNEALTQVYSHLITKYNAFPVMLLSTKVLATSKDKIHPDDEGSQMISDYLYNALHEVGAY
jgi:lysophospholipase L1-like esterase